MGNTVVLSFLRQQNIAMLRQQRTQRFREMYIQQRINNSSNCSNCYGLRAFGSSAVFVLKLLFSVCGIFSVQHQEVTILLTLP